MYKLGKRVISQYIRTGCKRRLRLDLYADQQVRKAVNAPMKDAARPGLALITQQGRAYEYEKYAELQVSFSGLVIANAEAGAISGTKEAYQNLVLESVLKKAPENGLLLEAEYAVTPTFIDSHRLDDLCGGSEPTVAFADVRPDIIHLVPANGELRRAVSPDGTLQTIGKNDTRLGLRVIDVKISGEASPAHFSELAYYSMTLAGWLVDSGHTDKFIVLADAAIWPGKHEASCLRNQEEDDRRNLVIERDLTLYFQALEKDLEKMYPEVVLGRVCRFLEVDLPSVIKPRDWRDLDWHIDQKCGGCDYLGYAWGARKDIDERYCWPSAAREEHLSRVAGVTSGARGKLVEHQIRNVPELARLPVGSPAYETHQALKAKRTVFKSRAERLADDGDVQIPDRSGTSSTLPRFADIRVAMSADFDIGSGLTFAFGYRISYSVPISQRQNKRGWERRRHKPLTRELLVMEKSIDDEGMIYAQFLSFLLLDIQNAKKEILDGYQQNGCPEKSDVSLQFYLWDKLIYEHLRRVTGRHLDRLQTPVRMGDIDVSVMSWLFPAEQSLESPDYVCRSSPITIVANVVNSLLAAPIPHHYGLIELANRLYSLGRQNDDGSTRKYMVNDFYRDPLSDQIPSERGHEIWERSAPFQKLDFQQHQEQVRSVVRRKLSAVIFVSMQLTIELADSLTAYAPLVASVFTPLERMTGTGDDEEIIYQHTRLMAAVQQMEIEMLMAMPPHEREARYASIRVTRCLEGDDRRSALQSLAVHTFNADTLVFEISQRSRDAKIKDGEFTWSLLPEREIGTLQHLTTARFKCQTGLEHQFEIKFWEYHRLARESLTVSVLKLSRSDRLIALQPSELLTAAIGGNHIDLDVDGETGNFAILDPIAMDVFTSKLKKTLSDQTGIRHPKIAVDAPLFPQLPVARIRPRKRKPPRAQHTSAADFIWGAEQLAMTELVEHEADGVIAGAIAHRPNLTETQKHAIRSASSRRLSVWWGPPGTGKSATVTAYIAGLLQVARDHGARIRVAVTGFTWVSIDNIAKKLPDLIETSDVAGSPTFARLSSTANPQVDTELQLHIVPVKDDEGGLSNEARRLLKSLEGQGTTIVASTVDQLHNLAGDKMCRDMFDVMIIDEASQLDIAHAIVGFSKLAPNARLTVVGDDKQMPPIHPIAPPLGLENLLGSVYNFFRHYRVLEGRPGIKPVMLDTSFRSNSEIIEFVREAGYGPDLKASPQTSQRRVKFVRPLETELPEDWPKNLEFSSEFGRILDPQQPLVAVVHEDEYSSQRNEAEAGLIAGLAVSLWRAGMVDLDTGRALNSNKFLSEGLGIVSPHRAQQSVIYELLNKTLPDEFDRDLLFSSIDTVERFQGQEKEVILASFGLGDADQIASEEEFLYSLSRFNVTVSRARSQFIAVLSRPIIDFLPRDREMLAQSRLIKHFVDGHLTHSHEVELAELGTCVVKTR